MMVKAFVIEGRLVAGLLHYVPYFYPLIHPSLSSTRRIMFDRVDMDSDLSIVRETRPH